MDVGLCDNLIDNAIWKYQFKKITGYSTCRQCDSWPTCLVKLWQLCTGCWATCNFHIWIRLFTIGTDLIFGIYIKPRKKKKISKDALAVDSVAKVSSMHLAFTASTTQVLKICNVYRAQSCPHRSSPNQNLNLNHCTCCCRQPFIFTKNEHVLFFLGSEHAQWWWDICPNLVSMLIPWCNLGKSNRACASSISN